MNVFPRTNLRALFRFAFFLLPFAGAAQDPAPDLAANPAVATSPLNPALPTLFIAGDSTASHYGPERAPRAIFSTRHGLSD